MYNVGTFILDNLKPVWYYNYREKTQKREVKNLKTKKEKIVTVYRGEYGTSQKPIVGLQKGTGKIEMYSISSNEYQENVCHLKILEKLERYKRAGYEIQFKNFLELEE